MVSWFVKRALLDIAALGCQVEVPRSREDWAQLMRQLGVKGVHIAERDTQRARSPRRIGQFVNTWSVDGFISEGLQPAELGWGTHEKWFPPMGNRHEDPKAPSIYLSQAGAATKVRTWCPTGGAQHGLCVTHNESISIADYFTLTSAGEVTFRPTCHYAYLPCDEAMVSWHELLGGRTPNEHVVLSEADIVDGIDELGVLLYGQDRNAYSYGSRLSNAQARELAPTRTLRACRSLRQFSPGWYGRTRTRTRASSRPMRSTSSDALMSSYRILGRSRGISQTGTR